MGELGNEAAWFRSPSDDWDGNFSRPRPRPRPRPLALSKSMPETRKVESWLSEASISDDEDNVCVSFPVLHFLGLSNLPRLKQLYWLLRKPVLSM
jgi:hypothetical protein